MNSKCVGTALGAQRCAPRERCLLCPIREGALGDKDLPACFPSAPQTISGGLQQLFPVPRSRALGARDINSCRIVIQVSAQQAEGHSHEGPQGIPMPGTAGIDPVSQEPGEGWVALTFSLSPQMPPSTLSCSDKVTLLSPHVLRRFSPLCLCSILWQDAVPQPRERTTTPHPKP